MRDRITPSDVDFYFDAGGNVMFCELARGTPTWLELKYGQRQGYWSMIAGSGRHCAALCHHKVPVSLEIDTRHNITSFQVMISHNGMPVYFARL